MRGAGSLLLNLHLKNLAIIDEADVDFKDGFNVLTGETGAGKSIIIGSVSTGLGGKVSKDMIRKGADFALIELLFSVDTKAQEDMMSELGIEASDELLISRKLTGARSVNRINGETVTLNDLRRMASVLIDIHGQNEQQSLLNKNVHRQIVDRYAKDKMNGKDVSLAAVFKEYQELTAEWEKDDISNEERNREISFMQYELNEIEEAGLQSGEEERLDEEYKKLSNLTNITKTLGEIYGILGAETGNTVSEQIGYCLRDINKYADYSEEVGEFAGQLSEIDDLVTGLTRDIGQFLDSIDNGEERLHEVSERLDTIRRIKAKYGAREEDVFEYADRIRDKLKKYEDYEEYRSILSGRIKEKQEELDKLCEAVSSVRKKCAKVLQDKITEALIDLNFLQVHFEIEVRQQEHYTEHGIDDVEFMISTNPGEDFKALGTSASGGELSRIMLAVKAVLAEHDEISTLIFDEIDVGISGRTAQKVAEKMAWIGISHLVICISHLAQIAAMADVQYMIEKKSGEEHTAAEIRMLSPEEEIEELARILGGAEITEAVLKSAKEMKMLARKARKQP